MLLDRVRPRLMLCVGSAGCGNLLSFLAGFARKTAPGLLALRSADIRGGVWTVMTFATPRGALISPLVLAADDPSAGPITDDAFVTLASAAVALRGVTAMRRLRQKAAVA